MFKMGLLSFLVGFELLAADQQIDLNSQRELNQARDRFANVVLKSKSKLVLLAEDHRDFSTKAFYKSTIEKVAKISRKKICYFLELGDVYQSALNRLTPDENSKKCFDEFHINVSLDFKEAFGRNPNQWLDTIQLAKLKQNGVKLFAVDKTLNKNENLELKEILENLKSTDMAIELDARKKMSQIVRDRNTFMSTKIKEAFAKGICEIGFLSVGQHHVFPPNDFTQPSYNGITDEFPEKMKTLKVNGLSCKPELNCVNEPKADLNFLFSP